MPTYEYRCPAHGYVEVEKPMARAGDREFCPRCASACLRSTVADTPFPYWVDREHPLLPMVRVYSGQAHVVRPTGWHLRPGDRGYSDFRRELELGEVRQGVLTDERRLDASLTARPAPPPIVYTDAQRRAIRNLGEVVDRGIREDSDLPETWREEA